jgi:hypothetical protein
MWNKMKTKYSPISTLLIFFVTISCTNHNLSHFNKLETVDLDKGLQNTKEIVLSQIATDIQYIPLETNPECLITDVSQIFTYKNRIIVFDERQRNIFLFDAGGKFIRKIGQKGVGPGEYNEAFRVNFNELDSTILIKDRDNKFYGLDGKFIYKKALFPEMGQINFLDDNIVFSFDRPGFVYNDNFQIAICDKNFKIQNRFINRESENITAENKGRIIGNMMNRLQYFSDTLSYWEYKYDTIYRIPDKNTCFPRYAFNYSGKQGFSEPADGSQGRAIEKLIESENYIFLRLFDPSGTSAESIVSEMIYFKKTKEIIKLKFKDNLRGIINDIDGGMEILPRKSLKDGRIYTSFSAFDLKQRLMKEPYINIEPLYPDKQNELFRLLDSSKMEDNPVIMLIYLK